MTGQQRKIIQVDTKKIDKSIFAMDVALTFILHKLITAPILLKDVIQNIMKLLQLTMRLAVMIL